MVSLFMQEPHELHWRVSKNILHYIQGAHTHGIHYAAGTWLQLVGYIESNYVGDLDSHKSNSGYIFHLGSSPICWQSKKQNIVSLSSTKVEYRGAINAATEALWLQHILEEFGFDLPKPIVIHCDNQCTIEITKHPVQHQWTKHIEVHMDYIRELIHEQIIALQYCPIAEQVSNIFTKPFTKVKYTHLWDLLGVWDVIERGVPWLLSSLFWEGFFPLMRSSSLSSSLLYSSLFSEEVFPMRFSLFLLFMRDFIASFYSIAFVHGYLTWPCSRDPSCICELKYILLSCTKGGGGCWCK